MSSQPKSTPHHDLAELEVLYTILNDSRQFWQVQTALGGAEKAPFAFWRENHRHLWRAYTALMTDAKSDLSSNPIHPLAVFDQLGEERTRELKIPALISHMSSACAGLPSVVIDNARIVRKYADLRDLISMCDATQHSAYHDSADPDELCANLLGQLTAASNSGVTRDSTMTAQQIGGMWWDEAQAYMRGESGQFWPTKITGLDDMLGGGIAPGRYYVVGGITKHGKTTLAIAIAAQLACYGHVAVDWVSVEMGHVEIMDKFLACLSGVDVTPFKRKLKQQRSIKGMETDWGKLMEAKELFEMSSIRIMQHGAPDVRDIEAMAHARRAELGPDVPYLIVVDYLQNLTTDRSLDETKALGDISRRLNSLSKSKQIGAAVMAVIQFNKEAENAWTSKRQAPRFSQIKGTSQVGNDANHLLILHRNYADRGDDPRAQSYTQIVQELSRHGGAGYTLEFEAQLALSRFSRWMGDAPTDGARPRR